MQGKFPNNTILESMNYNPYKVGGVLNLSDEGDLAITFKKGQIRTYHNVSKELAYKLYYKKTASEVLSLYSTEIKKKFKVSVK